MHSALPTNGEPACEPQRESPQNPSIWAGATKISLTFIYEKVSQEWILHSASSEMVQVFNLEIKQ